MEKSFKLSVNIGSSRFEAEGAEDAVKEGYAEFLAAIKSVPPQQSTGPNGNQIRPPVPPRVEDGEDLQLPQLNRVFISDSEDGVSLRILPRGGENPIADALVVLLYGFIEIQGLADVNSGVLIDAARRSGLKLDRIDTVIAPHHALITAGGYKRGRRYGLNNQGRAFAERTIRTMLG